jgi:hypothetical protein
MRHRIAPILPALRRRRLFLSVQYCVEGILVEEVKRRTRSNDADDLAGHVEAQQAVECKVPLADLVERSMQLSIQTQHHRDGVLGNCIRRIGRLSSGAGQPLERTDDARIGARRRTTRATRMPSSAARSRSTLLKPAERRATSFTPARFSRSKHGASSWSFTNAQTDPWPSARLACDSVLVSSAEE